MALRGKISLPGDKSISHRAVMFSAIADGTSSFTNLSGGQDVQNTIKCLSALGAQHEQQGNTVSVSGKGLLGLKGSDLDLDCGNSGTTIRLLTGFLSGQNIHNVSLIGDESLSKRPHDRVIKPLQTLGVNIQGREGSFTPIIMNQSRPSGGRIDMTLASAQVKSAILLSGLYASAPTTVVELHPTRNHTENMLRAMGAELEFTSVDVRPEITIYPSNSLQPLDEAIPGDPSSAAFFGVAAAIIEGSDVTIENVLLNPTRIAWVEALEAMGANITVEQTAEVLGEAVGNINVKYSELNAITISGDTISSLVDELPILAVAMARAKGTSRVRDASELRVKESDRITVVVDHLRNAGVDAVEAGDGYVIEGSKKELTPVEISAYGDHRIAMTFSILNMSSTGRLVKNNEEVISTSFPQFFEIFSKLSVTD